MLRYASSSLVLAVKSQLKKNRLADVRYEYQRRPIASVKKENCFGRNKSGHSASRYYISQVVYWSWKTPNKPIPISNVLVPRSQVSSVNKAISVCLYRDAANTHTHTHTQIHTETHTHKDHGNVLRYALTHVAYNSTQKHPNSHMIPTKSMELRTGYSMTVSDLSASRYYTSQAVSWL